MERCIKVAIAGLGSRGYDVYGRAIKAHPDKMRIVAVADPDPEKRKKAQEEYGLSKQQCFFGCEELLKAPKLADVLVIATLDKDHVSHGVPALEKGYDLLLEKPIAPSKEACDRLLDTARAYNRIVMVCHVLRYTPVYRKAREILRSGEIGKIVTITATENVGWFHYTHSFVRGTWAREEETSPIILQKCCHDMDLYLWLADKRCKKISSFGGLYLFSREQAPRGAAKRCLQGCAVKEDCIFDAEKIYLRHRLMGYGNKNRRWPLDGAVSPEDPKGSIRRLLEEGRYGRCVYACDNTVPDHQVVQMEMEDGSTFNFTMCGHTSDISRAAKFMGTKGEMILRLNPDDVEACEITVRIFGLEERSYSVRIRELARDFSGHSGGESRMLQEFFDVISGKDREKDGTTLLEQSMESHYCALAAEESRKRGGAVIGMEEFRSRRREPFQAV